MAGKFKLSEMEIRELCQNISHQIIEKEHYAVSDCLQKLRSICGAGKCGCSAFSPAHKLSQLLRAQLVRGKIIGTSVGLAIISNYAGLAHHSNCHAALENLLAHIVSKSEMTEAEKHFLDRLWLCPGLREFKIVLVSDFIHTESKYIEQDLLSIFESDSSSMESRTSAWEELKFERIVYWSSKLAKIFCTVSSILNSLLCQTLLSGELFEVSENIVTSFISCVKNSCLLNNTDFVLLYPSEYHSLVTLMDLSPSLYLQNSSVLFKVVELFKASLVRNPTQTLCLLSHFPEWTAYI